MYFYIQNVFKAFRLLAQQTTAKAADTHSLECTKYILVKAVRHEMGRERSCLLPVGRDQDPLSIKTCPSPTGMIVEIALMVPKHGVHEPLFASGQPATE